jgi:hypothetical protein
LLDKSAGGRLEEPGAILPLQSPTKSMWTVWAVCMRSYMPSCMCAQAIHCFLSTTAGDSYLCPMQEVMKQYKLREQAGCDPQTYALGLKEVWEVNILKPC